MPTYYQGAPEETLALDTFVKLFRATDSLGRRLARRGALGSVTPSQFGVLESLYHLGPLCQGEVSAKLLRSASNITLVLDNLEKRGLVTRERDSEDRRLVRISLTEAGRALIAQIFPEQVKAVVAEFGVLSTEEQQQLGALCKKLGTRSAPLESTSKERGGS